MYFLVRRVRTSFLTLKNRQASSELFSLTEILFVESSGDNLVETIEGSGRDEEDVGGVHLDGITPRLPGQVPLRDVDDGTLHHLEHALLDPLATDVSQLMDSGDCSDFVHLV